MCLCGVLASPRSASAAIVINEIHYNPDVKTEPAEFVELCNTGPIAVNLAGWKLSSGFIYTFPSTNVAPGRFVVVAQNPTFLQTKFTVTGVLGPFNTNGGSGLSKDADKVTLRNAAGQVEDEVSYQIGFPWPTVGDAPGYSIELINPQLDRSLGGNWRASTNGVVGAKPTPGKTNLVFALNAPPAIRQVEHTPPQPTGGVPVLITAKVTDPDGVGAVTLEYQIVNPGNYIELTDAAYTNATNWISLPMNDAGTNGDVSAGDDTFTAEIPAAVQTHRRLIRYRITVADTGARSVRVPYADDPQPNFAYLCYDGVPGWTGAVQPGTGGANGVAFTVSAAEMSRLPVYQLLTKSNEFAEAVGWAPGLPNNKYGGDNYLWNGTLVVDGKVYDHIGFRCRGGVWRYSMGKNAMKFSLNRGHDLEVKDNWGRKLKAPWRRLSFRPNIQQGDYLHRGEQGLFEAVGYKLYDLAGANGLRNVQLQFRVIDDARETVAGNQYQGDFYGLWLAVEEEDGRFLEERGLPDGNVYDMEGGTGTLNHLGALGPSDKSDLNALLTYGGASPTEAWWRTNLDLRSYYSYQAISQGIHQYDIADGKNYFYYRNPVSGLWTVWPWDLDLTWADNMYRSGQQGGDEPFKLRVLNNFASPGTFPALSTEFRNRVREIRDLLFNTDEAFRLIDEYWWMTRGTNTSSIVDADRAFWDYNPVMNDAAVVNLSKAGNYHFYQWQNEPGTSNNFGGAAQMMKSYIRYRSTNATFSLDTMSADAAKPNRPTITYTGTPGFPINRLNFQSSAYSGAGAFQSLRWRVAEITGTNRPIYNPEEPQKYEIQADWESGPIPAFNASVTLPANLVRVGSRYRARVLHTDAMGRNSQWSLPQEFVVGPSDNLADLQNFLRITELMYNPAVGGYEFIELQNTSASLTLDLAGVKFTQGVDFTFPSGATLAPGAFLVVVGTADLAGFRAYHGLGLEVAVFGPYLGSLNNAGEQLVLRTSAGGSDIVNFSYADGRGWPVAADGGGHSLIFLDGPLAAQGAGAGDYAGSWRGSTYMRGSPGAADAVLTPTILLNEIVAHTDFTNEFDSNDWIELHNPTDSPITLGVGWYLSDDGSAYTNLMKWAIPTNTTIPAHGWVSFDEVSGFHFPTNIGFGLNKGGEQVFLSYLPGTAQDRVVDAVSFKGQENDWSWGRYPDGGPFWSPLTPRTRGTANAAPPARVLINEVHYHPPDRLVGTNFTDNSVDEFVELYNGAPLAVTFHNTNGTWRINGGLAFTFPTNFTLAAGEYALLVNFNPATNAAGSNAFRNLYGITDPGLRILGPCLGKLANNSDRLALELPQHPDGTNDPISWVIVDEVLYADQPPWPCGSDGTGNSLQRLSATLSGNDPAQWTAEPPTAGGPRANLPAGLPTITSQPQNRVAATNGSTSFSVSLCGTPPFAYQWQFNSGSLGGATNATLNLTALTVANAGDYRVLVSNAAGSVTSQVATLIVQSPPFIITPPQSVTIMSNQSASFSVTAGGTPPLQYQWQLNGVSLPGRTNDSLLLTNVQPGQAGNYRVQVFNTAASVFSSNAVLTVQVPIYFSVQPTNQNVLPGTNVTLVAVAPGNGPIRYQWRFQGTNIPNATNASHSFTGANITDHHGTYSVAVEDDISTATSANAFIYVLLKAGVSVPLRTNTVLQGGSVTLSITATGAPPLTYRWLRNGAAFVTNTVPFVTVTNLQISARYQVVVTNQAGTSAASPGPGITNLFVLADLDSDGVADLWELAYGFSTNNAGDALLDFDGDGMNNRDEYLSGTNPTNALSVLKIVLSATNAAQLNFTAQSNISYTVQWRTNLVQPAWSNLTSITAQPLVRTVLVDTATAPAGSERYLRIVTPLVP